MHDMDFYLLTIDLENIFEQFVITFVYLTKIYDLLEEEYTYQHGNVSFNVLTRTFTLERKETKRKEKKIKEKK